MKYFYVPEVFESSETAELDDGYFIVVTQDDFQSFLNQVDLLRAEVQSADSAIARSQALDALGKLILNARRYGNA